MEVTAYSAPTAPKRENGLTPAVDLFNSVQKSRIAALRRQKSIRTIVERYHGRQYMGLEGLPEPENYAYSFVVHLISRLASTQPRISFTSKREPAQERVEALEVYNERWLRETAYHRERERAMMDMCFGTAIVVVTQAPVAGMMQSDDPPYRPQAVRLSPNLYGEDVDATATENARFKYHTVIVDRDDFLASVSEDDGWDVDACKQLVVESAEAARGLNRSDNDRQAIVYQSVWCPHERLPDSDPAWKGMTQKQRSRYHGTVRTLAAAGKGGGLEIRRPVPYFGPRSGPYATEGFLLVPDETWHLGPLTACDGQLKQLNAQARANDRSADARKKIAVFSGNTPDGKMAVLNAIDGDAISVPGFDPATVAEIEIGGITAEARVREMELRERVKYALGIGDAQLANASGDATATENVIVDQAVNAVLGLWKSRAASLDGQVSLKAAWFADQDERTVMRHQDLLVLGGQSVEEKLSALETARRNDMVDEEMYSATRLLLELGDQRDDGSFDDLEIAVELVGDDGRDEARMMLADEFLERWVDRLPMVAAYSPGLPAYFERKAEALRIPEIKNFFDFKIAAEVGAQQAMDGVASGAGPKPRLQSAESGAGRRADTGNPGAAPKVSGARTGLVKR